MYLHRKYKYRHLLITIINDEQSSWMNLTTVLYEPNSELDTLRIYR